MKERAVAFKTSAEQKDATTMTPDVGYDNGKELHASRSSERTNLLPTRHNVQEFAASVLCRHLFVESSYIRVVHCEEGNNQATR